MTSEERARVQAEAVEAAAKAMYDDAVVNAKKGSVLYRRGQVPPRVLHERAMSSSQINARDSFA